MGTDALFDAAGTLRPVYDAVDWARTPLGPTTTWSPTLRNAVDLALNTRFPVMLLWGPRFGVLYNEAFVQLMADKHPAALGAPAEEVFAEAWELLGPMMQSVRAGGGPTWVEDELVPLRRRGVLEDRWFTFSYSPVRGPDGTIEGVMDIAAETTREVVARRRVQLLGQLSAQLAEVVQVEDVAALALPLLRTVPEDLVEVDVVVSADAPPDDGQLLVEETPAGPTARMTLAPAGDGRSLVFVARLSVRQPLGRRFVDFVRIVAAGLRQSVRRVRIREAERAVEDAERGIAEALQRSLLSTPPPPAHLEVAVRYWPAARGAQVGGDWYDSFTGRDGVPLLVIGDVAGHDRMAVATMTQMRNLLRGVAQTLDGAPAAILTTLDEAMHRLGLDVFATAVLAQVDDGPGGRRVLRWSNAGHPPPVLVTPDGDARVLSEHPDVALGLRSGTRHDHEVALEPGASVVFYTDGLIERRERSLGEGLRRLRDALAGLGADGGGAEAICAHLASLLSASIDDDVALLVVTVPAPA